MTRAEADDRLLRLSLVAVWLFTAVASIVELNGQSREVLAAAGITSPPWLVQLLIGGGPAADLLVGLALWLRPGRASYSAALALMLAMTLVATVLQPSLWLHPLGPLLKNLPIAALLWHLYRRATP
ncbi:MULTISPECIES: DoxX-like family protein [Variovorax]|uniref:Epimerase n=1 Tax=Variovorax paradoxus TaxID=34073 RepID=A0AA91DN27_VARPD|nr:MULTISPECIES: DoxX-like family protein [Variovorax]AVQ82929.1 epimerase [Variovorax sp. PMC12]OAK63431.1 epimerase [Variovorax paradoxus]QRY32784.1 DoxX-like family protein [Variovorax sp. PDNC026]